VIFRLFYQARSFEIAAPRVEISLPLPLSLGDVRDNVDGRQESNEVQAREDDLQSVCHTEDTLRPLSLPSTTNTLPAIFKSFHRFSTQSWHETIVSQPSIFANLQIRSITWIKALASPFSHEFIQFVVEDSVTHARTRIAAGREENGDWVLVGWNWASGDVPSDHYQLPLPLLTLDFPNTSSRPSLSQLSEVLSQTTTAKPAYKMRREMCWWYAERVFEIMHERFGGKVEEWKWARYRYSFIVRTDWIRRKVLTKCAEEFRRGLGEGMKY
jgi:hypothetical protein